MERHGVLALCRNCSHTFLQTDPRARYCSVRCRNANNQRAYYRRLNPSAKSYQKAELPVWMQH